MKTCNVIDEHINSWWPIPSDDTRERYEDSILEACFLTFEVEYDFLSDSDISLDLYFEIILIIERIFLFLYQCYDSCIGIIGFIFYSDD